MKKPVLIFLFALYSVASQAQLKTRNHEVSLVFGLNQPLVTKGFNFEVNYWTRKFVIDYSHGFGLQFRDNLVSKDARDQKIAFHITHSAGIGFGYRFSERFNLRLEPKWHVWEMYYDDQFKTAAGKITTYNTFTLGLGAYYRWSPFEKQDNLLRGITIVPSVRWWPNVATSLKNGEYEYYNEQTDRQEVHTANNIGMSNTPFFVNISVGYTFKSRKKI